MEMEIEDRARIFKIFRMNADFFVLSAFILKICVICVLLFFTDCKAKLSMYEPCRSLARAIAYSKIGH